MASLTQCSVYQINIKVDFVILSCHLTLFMVVACGKFDSVACHIRGGGVSILSSARYQIILSTSIQSHPISITSYVAQTQCSEIHCLKCFNVCLMWQMWRVMLMLKYGLGAGVNRVFSCCPGTLAGHTSRSGALLSAQYTEVLPTAAILHLFLELWMFRFAISENSRSKITKSLLNGMVLGGLGWIKCMSLPLPIQVIKLGRM